MNSTTTKYGAGDSRPLRNTASAAHYLGVNPGTARNWRSAGIGPRYVRVGAAIRYRDSDLDAWLDARTVETIG